MGTHDELIDKDRAYAALVRLQHTRVDEKSAEEGLLIKRSSSTSEFSIRGSSLRRSLQAVGKSQSSLGRMGGVDNVEEEIVVKKPSPPSFRNLLAMNRWEYVKI